MRENPGRPLLMMDMRLLEMRVGVCVELCKSPHRADSLASRTWSQTIASWAFLGHLGAQLVRFPGNGQKRKPLAGDAHWVFPGNERRRDFS